MEVKPGYKQTDVGVVPQEWVVSELEKAARVIDSLHQTPTFVSDGYPMVRVSDIKTGDLSFAETLRVTKAVFFEFTRNYRPKRGDIVLSRVGSYRVSSFVETDEPFCMGQNTVVLQPKLPSRFLYYTLNSRAITQQIEDGSYGSGYKSLSLKNIKELRLPVPPTEAEQRAIAGALSDVDALLDALDRLIAKKRDLQQAAKQQLLTGETRFPGFHGAWEKKRLGDVATFHKGKGLPKSALTPFGAEPCIHYGELFTHYPETIHEIISRTDETHGCFRSVANDVLMPTSDVTPRGLAKASCIPIDGVILGGDILVIRCDISRVLGTFLSYLIRREEEQVLQLVTGTTVFHIYGTDMKKFKLALPTLAEQNAIAEVLPDMDRELWVLEQRREKTRALKQGMMQELLTGKTRLV
jgi:type I restriction enzyme, S subunit